MKRNKQPTWTSLALELLMKRDDFLTTQQVAAEIGAEYNQASAALHHLRQRHAVDILIDKGIGYWFATPDGDDRSFHLDERTPENKPRRPRRSTQRKEKKL